jgi:hypothetical protein
MNLEPNAFATELSNTLNTTKGNYTVKTINLGDYGTSCEITKHGSDRKLHLTPIEDDLIDMALFDGMGTAIANGTLFNKIASDITTEKLANLVSICF